MATAMTATSTVHAPHTPTIKPDSVPDGRLLEYEVWFLGRDEVSGQGISVMLAKVDENLLIV